MSSREVIIRGSGADTRVQLDPVAVRSVVAGISSAVEQAPTTRVYLTLESIRGTNDSSVLRVYLRFPEPANAAADQPQEVRVGSVGLYGLRRSSVRPVTGWEKGLRFVFDITPFFKRLSPATSLRTDEIIVSMRPQREVPADSPIVVGRIRITRRDYEVEG